MTITWPLQSDLKAMRAAFGNPDANGDGAPDPQWVRDHLTTIVPPYAMFYGGKPVSRITVNKGCAVEMLAALAGIGEHYGTAAALKKAGLDQFGGVYNFRSKRGNPNSLSMHAYACAIDLDPIHNPFQGRAPGRMPADAVRIFAEQGATWLGPTLDPMHFQFARTR